MDRKDTRHGLSIPMPSAQSAHALPFSFPDDRLSPSRAMSYVRCSLTCTSFLIVRFAIFVSGFHKFLYEERVVNGPLSVGVALSLSRFQGGLPRTLVAVNQSDSIPLLGARLYSVRNVAILRLRPWISDFGASVASLSHGIILRGLDKQPARTKDER